VVLGCAGLRVTWPVPSPVPTAAAALFALLPQVCFLNGYFNDQWFGLIAVGAIYWAAAAILRTGLRERPVLRCVAGLTMLVLSRMTDWPVAVVLVIAVARTWSVAPAAPRRMLAIGLLAPLLILGGWVGRNGRLYKAWDGGRVAQNASLNPVGYPAGVRARRVPGQVKARHPYLDAARGLARGTFMSYWGVFGYMGLLMPPPYYLFWLLFCLAAAAGLRLAARRLSGEDAARYPNMPTLLTFATVFWLVLLAHFFFNSGLFPSYRFNYQPQGRYLFGVLLPIVTFLALGLRELLRAARRESALTPLCALCALAANVWCLLQVTGARWPIVVWTP
jgi:hypothetical protein